MEKARIRRDTSDSTERERTIRELVGRFQRIVNFKPITKNPPSAD